MRNLKPLLLICLVMLSATKPISAQYGGYQMFHHWDFRPADGEADWGRAEVPGNLHLDLLRQNLIPDPFAGTNEDSLQWIGERDWSYRSHLHVTDSFLNTGHPEMVFEGLDTYADIYFNGILVQRTNNMFRRWVVPVQGKMQPGHNAVEIVFRAPEKAEAALRAKAGMDFPGGNRVFSRKAQYHYGWDWGPRYLTAGIWRSAFLQTWNRARILNVQYQLDSLTAEPTANLPRRTVTPSGGWSQDPFDPDTAWVSITIELEADGEHDLQLKLGEQLPGQSMAIKTRPGRQQVTMRVSIPKPKLWWSRGLGEPTLYRTRVWLQDPQSGLDMDQHFTNIGLRMIELVREQDPPSLGLPDSSESFYFSLNGVPVYARGANWIPTNSFLFGYLPDYERLLRDATRSNINMLRVWGGGIYELDIFYDWCSRNGILVWQDFMFACAMYPGEATGLPEVTENIRIEATEQIQRLRNYPALALWCGNNEIAEGWERWGWKDAYNTEQRQALEKDYHTLFEELLPRLTTQLNPEVPYWPSSPLFGRGDARYLSKGDAHDWWVWHDGMPFDNLEKAVPRFMSEFGFQAYPDVSTIEKYRGSMPTLFDTADHFLEAHQKHPRGAAVVDRFMRDEFGNILPDSFAHYVYLSQWLQADGMGRGFDAQHRARPYCMGSLYWQFNDVWPSVSWSGIDVEGRWKALQYRVRRSFSDVAVSSWRDDQGRIKSTVVSDRRESTGVVWEISLWKQDGSKLHHLSGYTDIPPLTATELWSGSPIDWPELKRKDIILHVEIRELGMLLSEHFWYPGKASDWSTDDPSLQWRVERSPNGQARVRLRSEKPVRGIWLQSGEPGWFSDNAFDLLPGREAVVDFEPAGVGLPCAALPETADLTTFTSQLKVMHLGQVLGSR